MASAEVKPLMVSVESSAAALGLGRTAIFGLLARGDLESVKVGARRLIPVAALEAYVERLRAEQVAEGGEQP